MSLDQFVNNLSKDVLKKRWAPSPSQLLKYLIPLLALYTLLAQLQLGFRPDMQLQLGRASFLAEIALLFALLITSVVGVVTLAYPDLKQTKYKTRIPLFICAGLALVASLELAAPTAPTEVLPEVARFLAENHTIECTIAIAFVSALPTVLLFALVKFGSTVKPGLAGGYIALAASAFGALTLRLAESNDSVSHLFCWHYLPIILLTVVGTKLGKLLLKW